MKDTAETAAELPQEELDLFAMLGLKGAPRLVTKADVLKSYKGGQLIADAIWKNIEARRNGAKAPQNIL